MLPFHQVCLCDRICSAFAVARRWPVEWMVFSPDVIGELHLRVRHALDMLDIEQWTEPMAGELDTLLEGYLVSLWHCNGIAWADDAFGPDDEVRS